MRRPMLLAAALTALLLFPAAATAKGPSAATISGPGLLSIVGTGVTIWHRHWCWRRLRDGHSRH